MEIEFFFVINTTEVILKKPDLCPHCGTVINPDVPMVPSAINLNRLRSPEYLNSFIIPLALICTACRKSFLSVYRWDEPNGNEVNRSTERILIYPRPAGGTFHQLVQDCSPEFITLYRSAFAAETDGHKRLAGAGYRMALEQLIKDYLIKEEGLDPEKIKGKILSECIGEHFSQASGLLQAADVVRILGNDFVHYQQKYQHIDFEIIRQYLDIFVSLIQAQLMVKHPPVSR
jgi:hypothetical protein